MGYQPAQGPGAGSPGVSAVLDVLDVLDRHGPTTLAQLARETGTAKSNGAQHEDQRGGAWNKSPADSQRDESSRCDLTLDHVAVRVSVAVVVAVIMGVMVMMMMTREEGFRPFI